MLPELRKKINKRNKKRARQMEQRVARFLKGNRVPMSGSGTLKGDCFVPFDEYRTIYVECKLTEKDSLKIVQTWLTKILQVSVAMRCLFGILVIHFVGYAGDWVLIHESDTIKFNNPIADGIDVWETVYEKKAINMTRTFTSKTPIWIQTLSGKWLILTLSDFKDRITEPSI
jgi:hypothetical protein